MDRAMPQEARGGIVKPKRGYISFDDRQTHALKSETTFFRRGFCGDETVEKDTIPVPVFITNGRAPICRGCVAEIEKEIQKEEA